MKLLSPRGRGRRYRKGFGQVGFGLTYIVKGSLKGPGIPHSLAFFSGAYPILRAISLASFMASCSLLVLFFIFEIFSLISSITFWVMDPLVRI